MRAFLGLLFAALLTSSATADEVHLTGDRTFEGVVAVETPTHLRLLSPIGEIRVPLSQVLSVVSSPTPLAEFLERRRALLAASPGTAQEWLELARWSRVQGLPRAFRESALMAARLEPHLQDLEPLMGVLDFVLDEETGTWTPRQELLHRRGLVEHRGSWLTREELGEATRQEERRVEQTEAARQNPGLTPPSSSGGPDPERPDPQPAPPLVVTHVVVPPPAVVITPPLSPEERLERSRRIQCGWRHLARRQPGSLIPLTACP